MLLVERGLAASRAEAQAAIAAGLVRADGEEIAKPSRVVARDAALDYARAHAYVSRGALKLEAALARFGYSPRDRICLDLGASTGGFTQLLLAQGARKVYAVDVGHGQLHPTLTGDPRVVAKEGINARSLSRNEIPEPVEALVADLSFISLKLALPAALALAAPEAWLVALIKPQFEVGRTRLGKGGIVRNQADRSAARDDIVDWISSVQGWTVDGVIDSPIAGGDGNREFLLAARRS